MDFIPTCEEKINQMNQINWRYFPQKFWPTITITDTYSKDFKYFSVRL